MIAVQNIVKNYVDEGGIMTPALKDVSFEIAKGEFVAIMGPSGSGKSTLLHILSFLDRPTSGNYLFFEKNVHDLSDNELARMRNKSMGFVFQSFNLLGRASVFENVEMPLLYGKTEPRKRKEMVERAIEAVGLEEKLAQEAGRLSGGQKQRVAIARAVVNDPDIIFADEPTGNLDSKSGAMIIDIFKNLNRAGRTIILVTHETYTAEFAERVMRMRDGMIEADEIRNHTRKTFFK